MQPATVQAGELRSVWEVFILAGIAVYAIVAGLIVWCAIAYRRRDPAQKQGATFHENKPLELLWTVIPILIVIGLFVKTYVVEAKVETVVPKPDEIVNVSAYRWSWRFAYPRHNLAVNGTPRASPVMMLPVDATTQINLRSDDVIHEFWVPTFMFKRDAVPGRPTSFDLRPMRVGTYRGECSEYCGTFHAQMGFTVRVLSAADYARWLAEHK
ncbi:MAG TPA: cytochrome c oxidase subunit II [Candidatus Baltobacteraceae bacterium]|jgi:cytochrome c oxidase subunit 2